MPLVNIALLEGKSRTHIRAIAEGVHRALVETYSVPEDDRFQLIREVAQDNFVFDPDYLGIHRTAEVVFIHITASDWRDTDAKKRLYARIAELLAQDPGLRPEDVLIVLSMNGREDWSFGKGKASYVEEAA